MSPGASDKLVIWRICDGRPGHDNQSRGLINAMASLVEVQCHNIASPSSLHSLASLLLKRFPAGDNLPSPDLIIGAGHRTHLALLAAKRARGGKTVVVMRPTAPTDWFDLCLVPDHDKPTIKHNVFITHGALNTITPGNDHRADAGLVLIGGPSRHCHWDTGQLLEQICTIFSRMPNISWAVSDSARTPDETRKRLRESLDFPHVQYYSCSDTGPGWVDQQLRQSSVVWVTADSISMIYESLTAGARTGIIAVPAGKESKITSVVNELKRASMIVRYQDWVVDNQMKQPPGNFNEARRAAKESLRRIGRLNVAPQDGGAAG